MGIFEGELGGQSGSALEAVSWVRRGFAGEDSRSIWHNNTAIISLFWCAIEEVVANGRLDNRWQLPHSVFHTNGAGIGPVREGYRKNHSVATWE